jgi:hypothetical protein
MKAFLFIILLFFGGMIYFLLSSPEEEEIEDFLVQEEVIFEEFDEVKPPPPLPKRPPMPKRQIAEVVVVEKEEEMEINLNLTHAINREKFGGSLTGDSVQGSLTIFDNQIQNLSINIKTPDGKILSLESARAELGVGGSFTIESEEELISGILINAGKGKYNMRLATGPLGGSALLFNKELSFEQKEAMEQAQISQALALAQRQEVAQMNEPPDRSYAEMNAEGVEAMPAEPVEMDSEIDMASHDPEYSEYDMEERAENSGYTI